MGVRARTDIVAGFDDEDKDVEGDSDAENAEAVQVNLRHNNVARVGVALKLVVHCTRAIASTDTALRDSVDCEWWCWQTAIVMSAKETATPPTPLTVKDGVAIEKCKQGGRGPEKVTKQLRLVVEKGHTHDHERNVDGSNGEDEASHTPDGGLDSQDQHVQLHIPLHVFDETQPREEHAHALHDISW